MSGFVYHQQRRMPANGCGRRELAPPGISNAVALLVAAVLCFLAGSAALAAGSSTQAGNGNGNSTPSADVKDVNEVTLGDIRKNYFKRYPFARMSDAADKVTKGESQSGGSLNVSDPAYKSVTVKCDYFSDKGSLGKKHEHYKQDQQQVSGDVATQRDTAVTEGWVPTKGLPMSDTMFQVMDRENRQRLLELFFDPERWMWKDTTSEHMKTASAANSSGAAAETSFRTAFNVVRQTLINVANERAAVPTSGQTGGQTLEEAIFIVQQMYKQIFMPMAILLLLPGAVLTQVKGLISGGFLGGDEDARSPFTGIMRALIAVFLIPSTQLIVSYSIDVGNALAWEVRDPAKHWIDDRALLSWASEQTFNPPLDNVNNAITPPGQGNNKNGNSGQQAQQQQQGMSTTDQAVANGLSQGNSKSDYRSQRRNGTGGPETILQGGGAPAGPFVNPAEGGSFTSFLSDFFNWLFGQQGQPEDSESNEVGGEGKAAGQLETKVIKEDQLWLSGVMQVGFNSSSYFMGYALTVLGAYQVVFMCYLFLLGPIAACFYAWPSGVGTLFKKVFSNWLDAVVVLALWRFWWCVILAVMTQRLAFVHPNPGSTSEMMVFNCFLALLLYIPFQPFNFHPGPIVAKVLEKTASGGGGGGGGAAVPGAGTTPGTQPGNAAPANQTPGSQTPTNAQEKQADPGKGGKDGQDGGSGGDQDSKNDGSSSDSNGGSSNSDGGGSPTSAAPTRAGSSPAPPLAVALPGISQTAFAAPAPPMSSPSGSQSPNAAVSAVQSSAGDTPVSAIPSGSPPTVALSPRGSGPKILVNTAKPAQAQAGLQAWQQAPSSNGGLRAIAAAPQKTPTSGSDASSADNSAPPAGSGAQAPVNANINVNVSGGGGQPQQQDRPNASNASNASRQAAPPMTSPPPDKPSRNDAPPPPLSQKPPSNF